MAASRGRSLASAALLLAAVLQGLDSLSANFVGAPRPAAAPTLRPSRGAGSSSPAAAAAGRRLPSTARQAEDFSSFKVADLKEKCKAQGISVTTSMKKADLVRELEAAFARDAPKEGDEEDLKKLTVGQLQERCDSLGLSSAGKKADLVARIEEAAEGDGASDEVEEEEEEEEKEEEPSPAKSAKAKKGGKAAAAVPAAFEVDETVEGYFEKEEQWYEAKVLKYLGGGKYNAVWVDDRGKGDEAQTLGPGFIRKRLADVDRAGPFLAGEAVEGYLEEGQQWHPGIIQENHQDGSFRVIWDEDATEHTLVAKDMKKIAPRMELFDLGPGLRMKATINSIRDFGAFVDVGAVREGLLHMSNIKQTTRPMNAPAFDVGERVTAYFDDDMRWHPGTIDSMNGDGRFNIRWDEGGDDAEVFACEVKGIKLQDERRLPFKVGDRVDVWVAKVEERAGRFSVSMFEGGRRGPTKPRDYSAFESMDPTVSVTGIIRRVLDMGFVVEIQAPTGARETGFVHLSQIRDHRVENVAEYGRVGDEVDVRVVTVDVKGQKMSLSMRPIY